MNRTCVIDSIRVLDTDAEQLPLTPIQRALLQAGVKILDADDVALYMGRKLSEAQRKAAGRTRGVVVLLKNPFP